MNKSAILNIKEKIVEKLIIHLEDIYRKINRKTSKPYDTQQCFTLQWVCKNFEFLACKLEHC